jgi:hypothetical protein
MNGNKTAFITLQENNAIATVDITSAKVSSIKALGLKNHNVAGAGLDASDEERARPRRRSDWHVWK